MVFKLDLSHKGKTHHIDSESEVFIGKKIGDKISGEEIKKELEGAEFTITGASDKAGFPAYSKVEGTGMKRVLLTKGFGLKKKHKKKKTSSPTLVKGIRMRRTVRANTMSADIVQINLKMTKEGPQSLATMLGKEEKPAEKAPETQVQ
ncbi:MAG: 30S ribosomal protein S6e [Nanoarchaeota archaeon]|nr:30S ribosomal protein S6e [Nanoarchaeota archaeon]